MTKKLYIFQPTFDVSTMLPNSTLLTSLDQSLECDEYHTSVGDMTPDKIVTVANMFDQVELIDHGFDKNSTTWLETKIVLNYLSHRGCVLKYNSESPQTFVDHAGLTVNNVDKKLWIFGCSHGHGFGLTDLNQRFGHLVAKHFDLPAKFITKPGSSLQWSLRHLVNANISDRDIVIWQITSPHRLTIYNNKPQEVMLSASTDRCLINVFNDQQIFFHHCSLINYGVNFLRAKNIKFVMVSFLEQQNLFYDYRVEFTKYPEFCYTLGCDLDLGTDNLHKGPLSHQAIALRIIDHLQYYNN